MSETTRSQNPYLVPVAIILAGGFIALSVYFSGGISRTPGTETPEIKIRAVSGSEHIRGRADADIIFVEYSDTECPYCKQFHQTMKEVYAAYGETGRVAWVYRNFPLESLHTKAPKQAEALECAAKLGGNDAFWKYTDRVYEITPSNDGLDMNKLPEIAVEVGLNKALFEQCLNSGEMAKKVADDVADAISAQGQGTPHTIVLIKGGEKRVLSGARPFNELKEAIDATLAELDK
jgi:protein-disulfide isomerase